MFLADNYKLIIFCYILWPLHPQLVPYILRQPRGLLNNEPKFNLSVNLVDILSPWARRTRMIDLKIGLRDVVFGGCEEPFEEIIYHKLDD